MFEALEEKTSGEKKQKTQHYFEGNPSAQLQTKKIGYSVSKKIYRKK